MEKPISVIITNVNNEIIDILQKYNLHPSVARLIVKDIYTQVCTLADTQAEAEKEKYEKSLKEEGDEKNE